MSKMKLLIADDERIERAILCRKLSREFGEACELLQAENGREAVRIFQERGDICAVILDIAMPGLNGIQAAAKIREISDSCIIIFLTAYSDFSYARQAIRLRALDYLTKPYQDEELFAVVEEALYLCRQENDGMEMPSARPTPDAGEKPAPVLASSSQEESSQIAKKITEFIEQNYMHEISMQDAARYMNYSETHFCKLFKDCFGTNFTFYLANYRMQSASRLLTGTDLPIHEISSRSGYTDSNYFAKVFKRHTGMIPSEYRRQKRNQQP